MLHEIFVSKFLQQGRFRVVLCRNFTELVIRPFLAPILLVAVSFLDSSVHVILARFTVLHLFGVTVFAYCAFARIIHVFSRSNSTERLQAFSAKIFFRYLERSAHCDW